MPSLIEVKNLTKVYTNEEIETPVLRHIDLRIEAGEFLAIMGPSGSGKSTLMHILGFLDRASGGEYFFKGKNVTSYTDDELAAIRNENVGFVFQAFFLLPKTSVIDNVKLPLIYSPKKIDLQEIYAAVDAVGLSHRRDHLSSQLSGGEKQRVAIARALVNQPDIIFADEPTGNLDSKTGQQVMNILQKLNDEGKTIVLVTHEKYTAEHAKRIITLHDGEIVTDRIVTEAERKLARSGELMK